MPTAKPVAWRGGSKNQKTLILHVKAILGVKYRGQIFFGQNPGKTQNHCLLSIIHLCQEKLCGPW